MVRHTPPLCHSALAVHHHLGKGLIIICVDRTPDAPAPRSAVGMEAEFALEGGVKRTSWKYSKVTCTNCLTAGGVRLIRGHCVENNTPQCDLRCTSIIRTVRIIRNVHKLKSPRCNPQGAQELSSFCAY